MRNILVTAISGDIGNGILKILKETDCHLYGCDVNEIAIGMDLVEAFWQSPYAVDPCYIEYLLEKCRVYNITHLIPVNEREIEVISPCRERFEKLGVKVIIQSKEVLDICLDKYKTAEFLSGLGLDVPKTYSDPQNLPEKEAKYIVKPRRSNGSKGIFIAETDQNGRFIGENAKEAENADDEVVFQEFIDSKEEYTIGVYRNSEVINVITFLRKLKHGYSNQVELNTEPAFIQLAKTCALAFDLKGYFNIQLRKKDGKLYIFEINPRISGTVRFRHMLGFTDVLWWLDLADGAEAPAFVCPYKRALGMREINEKYLILE